MAIIIFLFVVGIIGMGCRVPGNPTSVVKTLHAAYEKGLLHSLAPEATEMMYKKAKGMIAKTEEAINGDNAIVKVTYKNGGSSYFYLEKIRGKWNVDMEK